MWLHGQESVKVNYNPANFIGHKHSGSGDIIFFFSGDLVRPRDKSVI